MSLAGLGRQTTAPEGLPADGAPQPHGTSLPMPPRGKHLFGTVTVGERWQIVIPKQARELFGIEAGDALLVLGDEEQGLAILKADEFMDRVSMLRSMVDR